jgi:hypothetical protein
MRAIGSVSISLAIMALTATDAGAASGPWCATYRRGIENCGYATLEHAGRRCWALGDRADPIRSLGQRSGPVGHGPIRRGSRAPDRADREDDRYLRRRGRHGVERDDDRHPAFDEVHH